MHEEYVKELLHRLGCEKIRRAGNNIYCSCPHPDNHAHGDKNPSFSAMINDGGWSPYFCHGCHARGTLEKLALSTNNVDLLRWLPGEVKERYGRECNYGHISHRCEEEKPVFFEDRYLKPYLGRLSKYLENRGVLLDTARDWELGVDYRHKRAIFTVRDYTRRLAMIIGRDYSGNARAKYSNYVFDKKNEKFMPYIDHDREDDFIAPTKRFFLYGEHFASKYNKENVDSSRFVDMSHLIIVEGVIDVLKLWQYGYNAVAILGSYPNDAQVDKIVYLSPRNGRVIIMADGDEAGRKLTKELGKKLKNRVTTFKSVLSEDEDPGMINKERADELFKNVELFS